MKRFFFSLAILAVLGVVFACSSSTTTPAGPGAEAGAGDDAGTTPEAGGGTQCTAARNTLLKPINKVSTGQVKIVKDEASVLTLYVDATAGGGNLASTNPRVYLDLSGQRIDVNDTEAFTSMDWDLALKRTLIYTNSGDTGIGAGKAAMLSKAFDAVTAADADAAALKPEKLLDDECKEILDKNAVNPNTTFADWYNYENTVATPQTGVTYVVVGGKGKRYKVSIESYTGKPDGTTNPPNVGTGAFLLKVAPL